MLEPARRSGIGEVVQEGSAWLLENDDFERFLDALTFRRKLGDRSGLESQRFETLFEAMGQVRHTHGFAHFGSPSTLLDSHLKVVVRDFGLGLNRRLLVDVERFERNAWLEVRCDPRNGDLWLRSFQSPK